MRRPTGSSQQPQRTIGGKLNRLVLVSVGTALLILGAALTWREAQSFLEGKRAVMLATANVFASATSRAVADGDGAAVTRALRAIARVPGLVYADVHSSDGTALAETGTGVRLAGDLVLKADEVPSPFALLWSRTLTVDVHVIDGGRVVGELQLVADTTGLSEQFRSILLSALLAFGVATAIGLAFAFRLRRSITRPIEELTDVMMFVGTNGVYSQPVEIVSDDETGLLANQFNLMMADIRAATDRILAREKEIIERLGKAGEMRDDQTGQHVVRVAKISRIIAAELGLESSYIDDLCRASPMHDVGKISISDTILHKPGRLDAEERREMEQHARRGFEILAGSDSELVQLAAEIAISHHERWDGKGYPNKIAGSAIPLSGRITAVADVCDALLSERPYKQPWSFEAVHEFLTEESGGHFDPACVDAILKRWVELVAIYGLKGNTRRAA